MYLVVKILLVNSEHYYKYDKYELKQYMKTEELQKTHETPRWIF